MDFITWLQRRLDAHGCPPGPIDGIFGRRTIAALQAFQRQQGLTVTGQADAATVSDLRVDAFDLPHGDLTSKAEPVWLAEARRYMGLKEIAGARSNPTIIGFARSLGGWISNFYRNDDIPWCGLFVAHVIATVLPREPLPDNPLGALNWRSFGYPQAAPGPGTVLVFRRPGGGHVGFYVAEDQTAYHVLGGNQSNSVSITRVAKSRLVAKRWPSTAPSAAGRRITASAGSTALSKNEA